MVEEEAEGLSLGGVVAGGVGDLLSEGEARDVEVLPMPGLEQQEVVVALVEEGLEGEGLEGLGVLGLFGVLLPDRVDDLVMGDGVEVG